jgi:type IV secretion system protein VirD4
MSKAVRGRRRVVLLALGSVTLLVLALLLAGWPQRVYMWSFDALAYPPQALSEVVRASTGHGPKAVTTWTAWMRDVGMRYAALQGRRYASLGPVLLLELVLALGIPLIVSWRIAWFFVTRLGRVTAGQPHGSARWMDERETAGLRYSVGHLLLGDVLGKPVGLDERRQTMNVLLIGPPGSGKSSGLIIPNLLREQGKRSVVVTDLKNELRETCASALAPTHEVWVVNFLDPAGSLGYNPLALCTDEMATALFANAWITNTGRSEKEPFWDNAARELLLAAIPHLQATMPGPTLAHLNALLCHQAPDAVIAALEHSPAPTARRKALGFLGALRRNDRLLGSVFAEITPRFLVLSDPRVQATTSRAEVDFHRLADPDARPVALFVGLDRTLQEELKPLIAAFFLDLFRALSQEADARPTGRLARGVFLYGDEFGNMGAVPKMPIWVSTLRSAGVGMLLALQTAAQGTALYGREGMDTIKAACATKIGLSGMELADAKWFSDLAGQATAVATSASRQRGRFHVMTERGSQSEQETARPLVTPDEVRRLSPLEMLAVVGEMQPLRLRQRRWYQDSQVRDSVGQESAAVWRRAVPLVPPNADADLARTRPPDVEDAELDWERAVAASARGTEANASAGTTVPGADPPSPAAAPRVDPVEPDLISH